MTDKNNNDKVVSIRVKKGNIEKTVNISSEECVLFINGNPIYLDEFVLAGEVRKEKEAPVERAYMSVNSSYDSARLLVDDLVIITQEQRRHKLKPYIPE
ncbi:hypothetical protein [Priestia aryabhattai]